LYGRKFDLESLHTDVRGIYAESFKRLEDMDKVSLLGRADLRVLFDSFLLTGFFGRPWMILCRLLSLIINDI
jgi:hypothetical protein